MSVRLFARGFPLAAAGALLAGVALAQTAAPAAPASPAPASPAAGDAAPARAHPAVEKRILDLRSKLKITPDETKAFDDFAQVMRDNANRMDGLAKTQQQGLATMTAVDQMKAYEAMAQAHADDMQRLVPSFSRLYEALSPEQKKLADQSFRDFGGARRRPA